MRPDLKRLFMSRLIQFASILLYLSSCSSDKNSQNNDLLRTTYADYSLTYEVDTVVIPLDSVSLNSYSVNQFVENGSKRLYIGLNRKTNSLDFFDLHKRKAVRHIYIGDKVGIDPEGISSFNYVNDGSVFFIAFNSLYWMNLEVGVRKRIRLGRYRPDEVPKGSRFGSFKGSHTLMDPKKEFVLLQYFPNQNLLENQFLLKFDIKNREMSFLGEGFRYPNFLTL